MALFGEAAAFWAFFRPRQFATLRSASPLPFSSDFLTSLQDEGSDQHYFQNEAVREVLVEKRGEKRMERDLFGAVGAGITAHSDRLEFQAFAP